MVRQYLSVEGYVGSGHSQLKCLLGRPGSGKTHLVRRLARRAQELGYVAVLLSARNIRFQQINELYTAIASQIDIPILIQRLANRCIVQLGYQPADVPTQQTFFKWATQDKNRIDVRVRRDVEEALGELFKHERTHPNFSSAITQLAADRLGTHPKDSRDEATLLAWLRGERLPIAELRRVHISRSIDRYNARDMLRALAAFVGHQGYAGLFIAVDEMEDLLARTPGTRRSKYSGVARSDVYQSIREFIDALPDIPSTFVVLAGRLELLQDERRGMRSYDALWLRIQHEVTSSQFNWFAPLVDLDVAVGTLLNREEAKQLCSTLAALRPVQHTDFDVDSIDVDSIIKTTAGDGVFRRLVLKVLD